MLAVIMCLLCVNVLNLFKCMLYKCYSGSITPDVG
jgi:hypothetical protein